MFSFIRRHRLVTRQADNVKPERAYIKREQILQFCNNFKEEAKGVPACNIFNFDETNFTDDPETKTVSETSSQ